MTAAILSIGTELLRGEIQNTNTSWLCDQITTIGMEVTECRVVGDDQAAIAAALDRLTRSHAILIATGGLGPTTDDVTSAAVGRCLGVPLNRDPASLSRIEARLTAAGRAVTDSNRKQADFPRGASVLSNDWGTAPGFAIDQNGCRAFFLPGVPGEMRPMFERHIEKLIGAGLTKRMAQVRLRTYGAAEAAVNDALLGVEEQYGVAIGYRAHFPEIEVKALARRDSLTAAQTAARLAADEITARLGNLVYGEGERALPQVIGDLLCHAGWTLALAESCTGGLVSQLITQEPASAYFKGAVVCYANEIKERVLGVDPAVLSSEGAVCETVVRQMAEGVRKKLGTDVGLALSGIAGPSGGTADKPVGLVHYAVSTPTTSVAEHRVFAGERARIQGRAAYAVLDLLRRRLQA
jgi:nicotinamide-nucleotide amidase